MESLIDQKLLRQHAKFIESLPYDTLNSLEEYTGHLASPLNRFLRNGGTLLPSEQKHLDNIDSIFAAIPPLETSLTVYRGISAKNKDELDTSNLSFISTSYNKKESSNFAGRVCCIITITVPVGSKILCVESISQVVSEREILLDRGGSFVVNDVKMGRNEDEKTEIFVSYIPRNSVTGLSSFDIALESIKQQFSEINKILTSISSNDYYRARSFMAVDDLIINKAIENKISITANMIDVIEEKLYSKFQ